VYFAPEVRIEIRYKLSCLFAIVPKAIFVFAQAESECAVPHDPRPIDWLKKDREVNDPIPVLREFPAGMRE